MNVRNSDGYTGHDKNEERNTETSNGTFSTSVRTHRFNYDSLEKDNDNDDNNNKIGITPQSISRTVSLMGNSINEPGTTVSFGSAVPPMTVNTDLNVTSLDRYHEPSSFEKLQSLELIHSESNSNSNDNRSSNNYLSRRGCRHFADKLTNQNAGENTTSCSSSFPTLPPISSLDSGILEAERRHSGNMLESAPVSVLQEGSEKERSSNDKSDYGTRSVSLFSYPFSSDLGNAEPSPNESLPMVASVANYLQGTKLEENLHGASSEFTRKLSGKGMENKINDIGKDTSAAAAQNLVQGNLSTPSVSSGEVSLQGEKFCSMTSPETSTAVTHNIDQTIAYPCALPSSGAGRISKPRRKKQCPICLNFFANLSTHKSTHLTPGDRPHLCPICQRGFARNNDLIRHKKRHWQDEVMARVTTNSETQGSRCNSNVKVPDCLKHEQLKSLHRIEGTFKCPYNTALIQLDMEMYPDKAQPLKFGTSNCHQTGVFSRCDTYKNHLRALHFEYPSGTKKKDRGSVPGRCKHCGETFENVEVWFNDHVGKTCGYRYH